MNIRKISTFEMVLTSLLLGSIMIPSVGSATTLSQTCKLNSTCPIPGLDGGQTVFKITPANGLHYVCEIASKGESLKFSASGGKNFGITKGYGIYNANPNVLINIVGRFKHPQMPNDQGEIKFTKLPMSSEGTVCCYAKS